MTTETTNIPLQHIPLNKLVPWEGNVRRTGASDGINELAASITAHGLLQSLVVRKGKRGKYEIIAGRRRYLALKSLVRKRKLAKDHPVPCKLADDAIDASELSLAENIVRMPMHPADQFETFRNLIDGGASVADVAARFGVSESLVTKRLKLGRVSPVILGAYRNAEISLELVQAFTVSDDHEAQERVWNETPPWNLHPGIVKRALTIGEIPVSDKRVRLIGLDARAGSDKSSPDDDANSERAIKLSARLTEDLSAQKSAAISAELAKQPDMALAAVVHAMALDIFYHCARTESCLQITASVAALSVSLYSSEQCTGLTALETAHERLGDHLPGDPADLWACALINHRTCYSTCWP